MAYGLLGTPISRLASRGGGWNVVDTDLVIYKSDGWHVS